MEAKCVRTPPLAKGCGSDAAGVESQISNAKTQISSPSPTRPCPRNASSPPVPSKFPQAALLAMARQVRHHRTAEFRGTMSEVLEGLKYAFQTANDVLILSCSGTGGMEAAVVNLVPPRRQGPGAGVGQVRRAMAADRRAVRHRSRARMNCPGARRSKRPRSSDCSSNIRTSWPSSRPCRKRAPAWAMISRPSAAWCGTARPCWSSMASAAWARWSAAPTPGASTCWSSAPRRR